MEGLVDYFPWYAWAAVLGLAGVAAAGLLIPPTVGAAVGLSVVQHLVVVAAVELAAAAGIGAIVVHYRDPDGTWEREWEFDP
jgi:hypothetical protein